MTSQPHETPPATLFLTAKSAGFYFGWAVWTLLLSPLGFSGLFLPQGFVYFFSRIWVRGILRLSKFFLGITYRIKGIEYIPLQGPYIIASKHQSTWETLLFNLIIPRPAFVLKRTLFYIPIIGWLLRKLGMIGVSRKRKQDKISFLAQARSQVIDHHRPLIIFPEGTRTIPGQKTPYRHGVFLLYHSLNIPVIPVALNSGFFWGRRTFTKFPGIIEVVILPPIAPGLDRETFMRTLTTTIEATCDTLRPSMHTSLYSPSPS